MSICFVNSVEKCQFIDIRSNISIPAIKFSLKDNGITAEHNPIKCKTCGTIIAFEKRLGERSTSNSELISKLCDVCEKNNKWRQIPILCHVVQNKTVTLPNLIETDPKVEKSNKLCRNLSNNSNDKSNTCSNNSQNKDCGKSSGVSEILNVNREIRNPEKKFECKVCLKTFSSRLSIDKHLLTHVRNDKKCHVCQKTFLDSEGLKMHIKEHNGEQRYHCQFCNNNFSKLTYLKTQKIFQCDICSACFPQLSSLNMHLSVHGFSEACECKIYGKNCRNKFSQMSHLRTHHIPYSVEMSIQFRKGSHHTDQRSSISKETKAAEPIELKFPWKYNMKTYSNPRKW